MHLPDYSGTLSLLFYLLLFGVGILGKKRRKKRDFPFWMLLSIGVGVTTLVLNLHWAHLF